MYPKSIRTTTFHIHRGGRGEDGAHYIGGGWGGGMATLDHIYSLTSWWLAKILCLPFGEMIQFDLYLYIYIRSTPPTPVTVNTRIVTVHFLVGNPYKPFICHFYWGGGTDPT